MDKIKVKSFTDLEAWKEGHKLVLTIYRITREFPKEEKYALADQMRRAAVSITSNIAEGFTRESYKGKLQFYSVAKASNTEIQNQLLIARDIGYIKENSFDETISQSVKVSKLLSGLIKYCRNPHP